LEVNERGVEADAATAVEFMAGSSEPEDPFLMTVNRPFVLAIADKETRALLFVGTVTNPNGD
jgi:serpin B